MTMKDLVTKRVLNDLDIYFREMAEHEDQDVQNNTSLEERCVDFYVYMFQVKGGD